MTRAPDLHRTDPGWLDANGRKIWPVDLYRDEGPRTTDWLAQGVIKQHRTIATHFALLRRGGFALTHLDEWGPSRGRSPRSRSSRPNASARRFC